MARIAIVTDSTASLPQEMARQHDIHVVPLKVSFGPDTFRDGIDITSSQFVERLQHAKELPKTSQPSIGDFIETFEQLGEEYDSVIAVLITSKLSGTYSSATQAADDLSKHKITVIDSLNIFMGHGFMAIRAAEAAAAGESHENIVRMVEDMKKRMSLLLVVDTLEYLQRGGRITGAAAFLGGMLNLKPLLELKDGALEPLQRIRSKKKANERLAELVVERCGDRPAHIALGYAGNQPEITQVWNDLRPQLNVAEFSESELGPAISTHTGPGVVGAAFYTD